MKHIEKRILLLENTYRPDPEDAGTLQELLFLYNFPKVWPDPKAAPKFALAACRRIAERFGSGRAKAAKANRTGAAREALDG